jgi:ribosomal protein S12 methylthiotransferase
MRFWIDRHGCAKNDVDGEEIAARLEAAGHLYAPSAVEADLVIVNSCGFIEEAKKESIEAVASIKASYPDKRILLAGCLSQRYAKELAEGLPEADGIVGNSDLSVVIAAAEATMAGKRPVIVPEASRSIGTVRRLRRFGFSGSAHVKATEGCSNCCSFCAIPLIRGALRSRPIDEVVDECRDLIGQGVVELVLIGQDLGSYGRDLAGASLLPELLERLTLLEGDFRVRTLYIHPDNFPERILEVIASDPRLLPYFDLPFQAASERLLKAMNRRGSGEKYLELIARIRSALPDAAIRSTFLLGFPGETEEDFLALRDFQERARLDWLGSFAYSREEDTAAYGMRPRVLKKTVEARRRAVEEAQERITHEVLGRFVGRELDVLVEEAMEPPRGGGPDSDDEKLALGRAWNQAPDVDGLTVLRGRTESGIVVRARVLAVNGVDFDAVIIGKA